MGTPQSVQGGKRQPSSTRRGESQQKPSPHTSCRSTALCLAHACSLPANVFYFLPTSGSASLQRAGKPGCWAGIRSRQSPSSRRESLRAARAAPREREGRSTRPRHRQHVNLSSAAALRLRQRGSRVLRSGSAWQDEYYLLLPRSSGGA